MNPQTTERIKKSEPLTIDQWKHLIKFVDRQHTVLDASILLGITRQSLDRILIVKSGSPGNIEKILAVLRRDTINAGR